jgi:aspartate kinase
MSALTAQPMPRAVARGPAMMRGKGVARAATASPARLARRRLPHRAGTLAPVVRAAAAAAPSAPDDAPAAKAVQPGEALDAYSVVMKFGGSSVADAERMREVASIVLAFPEEMPVLVLSAMGKTTNNLLAAGEQAMQCDDADEVAKLEPVVAIRKLHEDTMDELGVDDETRAEVSKLLNKMEQVCTGVALMQECTSRTRATLVSFGERMSTRIFASYLRSMGLKSTQYDAFDALGFVTTDEFENGNILPVTYENVAKALRLEKNATDSVANIAVVTGFLGRGEKTGAIATLGRGGSDLTATVIGAALALPEVYVWKDVDGVLSADPREVEGTVAMAFLSFQEATELAYFGAQVLHPQSMRPAMDSDALCVRVKNSYNVRAPGTLIGHERPGGSEDWLLTSIVRKKNVTMLDIVSTRMLGQYGFLAKVFNIMDKAGISVDCVATSEVSVSLTLDPAKVWSRDLVQEELDALVEEFENAGIARVKVTTGHSLISLIGNVERNNEIMQRGFKALGDADVKVQMISQGASKTNISLLVNDEQGSEAVNAIHHEFFPYEYGQILPSGDEDE